MELDSIRWEAKSGQHPAAKFDDLPEEVQYYISFLENDISDEKGNVSLLFMMATIVLMIYCALSALNIVQYYDIFTSANELFVLSIAIFTFAFHSYRTVRQINLSRDANKELLKIWEINYIDNKYRLSSKKD